MAGSFLAHTEGREGAVREELDVAELSIAVAQASNSVGFEQGWYISPHG